MNVPDRPLGSANNQLVAAIRGACARAARGIGARALSGARLGLLGCVAGVALGLSAPAAFASTHTFSMTIGSAGPAAGQVSAPQDAAVNDASGNIYVADTGNQRVDEFDSTGSFVRAWGWGVADGGASFETCTSSCQAGSSGSGAGQFEVPTFVAVDNSSGPSAGDVYVGDPGDNVVTKFDPNGNLIGTWATNGQLSVSAGSGGEAIAGITLDSSGNLNVYDANTHEWLVFSQDGTAQPTISVGRGTDYAGIAVDSDGNLYKVLGNGNVEQYSASGSDVGTVTDDEVDTIAGFAIDPSSNDVYADDRGGAANGNSQIRHYDGSTLAACVSAGDCAAADTFGSANLSSEAAGLAYDPANSSVYVADPGANDIAVFVPPKPGPPTVDSSTADAAANTATITAQVNPWLLDTSCEIQYVDAVDYQSGGYANASTVPCSPADLGSGYGDQTATANLTGLTVGTTYHYRVIATNSAAPNGVDGADQTFVTFGVSSVSVQTLDQNGNPYTQAGGHPYELVTDVQFNTTTTPSGASPAANFRDLSVDLPPGLIGNPTATPTCPDADLVAGTCSGATQVGIVNLTSTGGGTLAPYPLYSLVPPAGVPARFGFYVNGGITGHIDASVRTGGDYGISAAGLRIAPDAGISEIEVTIWGVPADPSHDAERYCPDPPNEPQPGCSTNTPLVPFLTNPTSCSGPLSATARTDSWQDPGDYVTATSTMPALTGCSQVPFNPSITVQPDTTVADSPSGLSVDLHMPQDGLLNPTGVAEANLKDATVTLPQGVSVDPSAASGLSACTPAEIGLDNANVPSCPDSSKIGSVEVDTPLLSVPLTGGVYVAQQDNNPFNSLLAIYVTAYDPVSGVLVKLAGHVVADPVTGQLETTFSNNPQLPFTDFKLDFFGGSRGVLATPDNCGTFSSTSDLSSWSGSPDATPSDSFSIDSGCVSGFSPSFTAGTQNAQAGAYSPFMLSFSRADTDQELSGLTVKLPPGMVAKLAGVQECSDAELAAAAANTGAQELANPSCPAGSQVGTVTTGAGPGPDPFFLSGKAYLTGPYKGAPYGLAVVVPAVAGPYDLGTVVVRQALYVDPTTAQVTAVSDPFPTILQGIPLRLRRVDVDLNRPDFTVNPTSCNPMAITGALTSSGGMSSDVSSRFQVGGCAALAFSPKLKLSLTGRGQTRSADHPTLTATLTQPSGGQANIKTTSVALPLSLALDPNNSQHVCSYAIAQAVHGGAVGCPSSTIVGSATAYTPLLSQPLTGKVYLVQGFRTTKQGVRVHTFPTLLIPLRGQIALDLRASTNVSGNEKLVTTFATIPDAAVSKFVLTITGGKRGLIVITGLGRTICGKKQIADANLGAQSGKTESPAITMSTPCAKVKKGARKARAGGRRA